MIPRSKLKQMKDIAHCSKWNPVSADGRNQLERIGTLYTQVLLKAQQITINSRTGPAKVAIASPQMCALIERITGAKPVLHTFNPNDPDAIHKVATFRNNSIDLYRDVNVEEDYILLAEHLDDVVDPASYQLINVTGFSKPEAQVICKDCGKWNIWETGSGCFWLDTPPENPEPQKCSCGTELSQSDKRLVIGISKEDKDKD